MTNDLITPILHTSARAQNRERFKLPLEDCWEIFCDLLYFVKHAYKIEINSFVLMPNHFHLLFSAPQNNAYEALCYFMRETAKALNRDTQQINHTWGSPCSNSRVDSYWYFMNVYKYIYYNPVKARLVSRCEDYKYSTLYGLLGREILRVPLVCDEILFNGNIVETLNWLNRTPNLEQLDSVRRGLKKANFELPNLNHRPNPLETSLL